MILAAILFIPVCGGIIAWLTEPLSAKLPRWVSLITLAIDFLLTACLTLGLLPQPGAPGPWLASFQAPWVLLPGVSFHLAVDGTSLVLITLTAFLGCMGTCASWNEITERMGFFHLCLTWTIAGVLGVFLSLDLFLFYFAWEFMLVPMYFLISLWGHEDRFRAAVKFFLFTQLSGLFMLASIIGLYFAHGRATGVYTFDYEPLLHTPMPAPVALLLQLGFLAAFLVKLPAVPFHTWLPDAHTQAPTAAASSLPAFCSRPGPTGCSVFQSLSSPRRHRA